MNSIPLLEIQQLHVSVEGKAILHGVNLTVREGEIHALMGPNGSGKSTLSNTLMGHPRYQVTQGKILFRGEDLSGVKPDERARKGLFLAFQYPMAIPGVSVLHFLRTAAKAAHPETFSVKDFRAKLKEKLQLLEMNESFMTRYVNDGFSGGEKKRHEILQMALLEPAMAVLDETDSGLDIDALKTVAHGITTLSQAHPAMGVLLITHYQRLLNYVQPQIVHVLKDGQIVETGGAALVAQLEAEGYKKYGIAEKEPEGVTQR